MKKIIRITTSGGSLKGLLKGQLRFMNQHFEVIGIANDGKKGFMKKISDSEGVKTYHVDMTRQITPFKDFKALLRLYKIFRREKPDIVHTHTPKAGTLGMMAAKFAGVSHRLHTIAGLPLLETTGSKRKLLNVVEKFTYSCATLVLPNSYALKQIILDENFTSSEKLKVIGNGSSNGINVSHYDAKMVSEDVMTDLRQKLNISTDDLTFIFIGRMVRDKGVAELVEAFNDISKANHNCNLILVGPREDHLDPLPETTENTIRENERIHDVGYQLDIRPFVAISKVLAFPSYREGFPNVVLQASCMELPCIVSDINGCNEIIEDKVNGLVIPVKNSIALQEAMQFMIDNPDKREAMIPFTRSRIIERYEQGFVWNELLSTYRSLN